VSVQRCAHALSSRSTHPSPVQGSGLQSARNQSTTFSSPVFDASLSTTDVARWLSPARRFHALCYPRSTHRVSSGDSRCLSSPMESGARPRRFIARAARRSSSVHPLIRRSRTFGSICRVRTSQPESAPMDPDLADTQIPRVPVHKARHRLCVRPVTTRERQFGRRVTNPQRASAR
jgi:hypothetical protein